MLRSLNSYQGQTIAARDGDIGKVHDFLFEDDTWAIRYLIADTRRWLPGRKVLIASREIPLPDPLNSKLPVDLTKEKIESSPTIDADRPVSRQEEQLLHHHYGWPLYWAQPTTMGGPVMSQPGPVVLPADGSVPASDVASEAPAGDPNLRSLREVEGYDIEANDGTLGHVEDLIVSDDDWIARYLVVDTRNWLSGKKVLLPPNWKVQDINWSDRTVSIDLSREKIKQAPEYDPQLPIGREYEIKLHDYYGRPAYWETHASSSTHN